MVVLKMLKYGDRIAKLRGQHDLTQEELANKIGISRAALSHYEKNRREPDYETLQRIAKFFEVTTDYLLGGLENARPQTVIVAGQEINLTEEEFVLFNELKKHPIMMHDLASDPERKVKELIKLYKMKKMFLEDDDKEHGDGFGTLKD